MSAIKHRVGQGLRALLATCSPVDLSLAQEFLSAKELTSFRALSRADQMHSLNVLRAVMKQRTVTPRTLAAAALLHDIGKSRYHLTVWQKTLAVLVAALSPPLAKALGQDERLDPLRAPFTVSAHHARWGGEILRGSGSNADVVWLVQRHQDSLDHWRDHNCYLLLQRLQAADEDC